MTGIQQLGRSSHGPPSPKAAGSQSCLSFSSAETVTPDLQESGVGGRPASRVSWAETVSPVSRPSTSRTDQGERIAGLGRVDASHRRARPPPRPGEFRRRKYAQTLPGGPQPLVPRLWPASPDSRQRAFQQESQAQQSSSPRLTPRLQPPEGADESEVLVEGPLQERRLLFLWSWRYCVLDRQELRVYANEEASLMVPDKPLERYSAATLRVKPDLHFPSVLICRCAPTGETVTQLRTGPGLRWEELAASTLWLGAFASAAPRRPSQPDDADRLLDPEGVLLGRPRGAHRHSAPAAAAAACPPRRWGSGE